MPAVIFSSYFPNLRYVSKFIKHNNIIIDIYENFTKQTYRNRCNILTANGISTLTVPVKKNFHCLMKDIEIDYSEDWQKRHFRSIMSSYKNSAFYDYYIDDFMPFFVIKEKYLVDLNSKILDKVLSIVGIEKNYIFSNEFITESYFADFRASIHPKPQKNITDKDFLSIKYIQVFSEKYEFCENLSILDLIFNEGPLAKDNLKKMHS